MDAIIKRIKRDGGSWDAKIVVSMVILIIAFPGVTKVGPIAGLVLGLVVNAVIYSRLRKGSDGVRKLLLKALPIVQVLLALAMAGSVVACVLYVKKMGDMGIRGPSVVRNTLPMVGFFLVGAWQFFGCRTTRRLLDDPTVVPFFQGVVR